MNIDTIFASSLKHTARRSAAGFTLIELMVTVTVAAILLSVAVPSFQSTIRRNRVASATSALQASLNTAKSEAIRQNTSIRFCISTTSGQWAIERSTSSTVHLDSSLRAGELEHVHVVADLDNAGNDTAPVTGYSCVRFRPDGMTSLNDGTNDLNGASTPSITITPSSTSSSPQGIVNVLVSGAISSETKGN